MPGVIVYDPGRNWILLIKAVTSAGPIDGKRRKELKDLFKNGTASLVFVTAFSDRKTMRRFLDQISYGKRKFGLLTIPTTLFILMTIAFLAHILTPNPHK